VHIWVLKCVNRHLHSLQNFIMKPERLYTIIFDAVYESSTLSSLLFTLGNTKAWKFSQKLPYMYLQHWWHETMHRQGLAKLDLRIMDWIYSTVDLVVVAVNNYSRVKILQGSCKATKIFFILKIIINKNIFSQIIPNYGNKCSYLWLV